MRDIFLDRDGVINENSNYHIKSWDEFLFLPHVLKALRWLRLAGFRVFVVTNQAIVSRGVVSSATIEDIHTRMLEQVVRAGGYIHDVRFCPHDDRDRCACRKPRPGMLLDLASTWQIDLSQAYLVGDALTDIAAARAVGCRAVLVRTGRGVQQMRRPEMVIHRPDHVAADLLAAVQWIFYQEWMVLPHTRRVVPHHDTIYAANPILVTPGVH